MHIVITDDPEKIREIKGRYWDDQSEFHLVPILEFPEDGIEEMFLDNLCVDILASGNRVVICSMEFAERLRREIYKAFHPTASAEAVSKFRKNMAESLRVISSIH